MNDMLRDMFEKCKQVLLKEGYEQIENLSFLFDESSTVDKDSITQMVYYMLVTAGQGMLYEESGDKERFSEDFCKAIYILTVITVLSGVKPEELMFEETKSDMLAQLIMDSFSYIYGKEYYATKLLIDCSTLYGICNLFVSSKEYIHTLRLIWIDLLSIANIHMSAQNIYYGFNKYVESCMK